MPSPAFSLKLIALVRSHPQIWNRNDPRYRIYNRHYDLWKQIAQDLGVRPEQASHKWTNLRSNYSRYLRSLREGKKLKFHLSEAMDFLRPHMDLRESRQQLKDLPTVVVEEGNSVNAEEREFDGRTSCAFTLDTGCKDMMVDCRNTDAVFLLSLLPQMGRMSSAEKRLFKQQALELSQEFLDGGVVA